MELVQKIIEVSLEFGSAHVFCEFTDQVYQNIGCQKIISILNVFWNHLKKPSLILLRTMILEEIYSSDNL